MNRKILGISIGTLVVALLINSNLPAVGTTKQSKEIQSLQKQIKSLEANVKALQASVETMKSSNLKYVELFDSLKGAQIKKLSFVAYQEKDLICPMGSTPAEKLDGRNIQKGFPDGFSFKNIRAFGLLGGSQIDLGVCEITILSK